MGKKRYLISVLGERLCVCCRSQSHDLLRNRKVLTYNHTYFFLITDINFLHFNKTNEKKNWIKQSAEALTWYNFQSSKKCDNYHNHEKKNLDKLRTKFFSQKIFQRIPRSIFSLKFSWEISYISSHLEMNYSIQFSISVRS